MEERIKELMLLKKEISTMIDNMISDEKSGYFTGNNLGNLIHLITTGVPFSVAELPSNDKTATLLNGLKTYDFVSKSTKLEHFRVIFGIYLHKKDAPFKPIIWRKNKQLLRFFIYTLFPRETIWINTHSILNLFSNTHGEQITLPESDKRRLEQSSDYPILDDLLKKFNE